MLDRLRARVARDIIEAERDDAFREGRETVDCSLTSDLYAEPHGQATELPPSYIGLNALEPADEKTDARQAVEAAARRVVADAEDTLPDSAVLVIGESRSVVDVTDRVPGADVAEAVLTVSITAVIDQEATS